MFSPIWRSTRRQTVGYLLQACKSLFYFGLAVLIVPRNNYTLPLLDYPLWWVVCSYDYVTYTGDVSYMKTYYPNLLLVLDTFYPNITNPDTGLVEKGRGETNGYGDYAFTPRYGPVTYYNALYVQALRQAADLAEQLSKKDDAARWRARGDRVAHAIATLNFDSSVGAFYDGTCGSSFCNAHAQDGNSLAILNNITNSTIAQTILSYYSKAAARPYGNAFYDTDAVSAGYSNRVYAFISYFEIAARFKSGLANSALEELRRLYGFMSRRDPGVTFWEGIGDNGSLYEGGYTSMAHGWATGVVPLLSNYILGVTPTSPGFRTWRIRPAVGDLKWARGAVPTSSGEVIKVQWEVGSCGMFKLMVKAPRLSNGVVSVPVGEGKAGVYVNGEVVWDGSGVAKYGAMFEDGYVSIAVTGGKSVIEVGYNEPETGL
jgi:hypothetical protein